MPQLPNLPQLWELLSSRRRQVVIALAAVVLVALVGFGFALKVALSRSPVRPALHVSGRAVAASPVPASSPPAPAGSLAPAKGPFVPSRLMIRRLQIDAPIEVKGIDSHNRMEAPDQPLDAAWYRFTTMPGAGGNAVFSGHLDAESIGPAIFWRLTQLKPGDVIEIVSPQSTELRYRVTQTWDYPVATIPMKAVLYPGGGDQITLITCSGHYKPGTGYDHRLVVRAVPAAAPTAGAPAA
jgi:LPXTG-site transpeptidase (sortase) family protein